MSCCVCQKSKTTLVCGVCGQDVCKACTEFLEPDSFSFLKNPPDYLKTPSYCATCFTHTVSPDLARYQETMEKAKNINVFEISQGKETRLVKRKEAQLKVVDCADKNETILRLAFWAAELGFNAIIDVDLKGRKVKDGRYQHTMWTGTAIPANINDKQLVKDRSIWSNPN